MFRGKMFPEARFNNGQEKAKQRNVFRVAWYKETSFNRKGSNKKKKKADGGYGNRGDKAILSGNERAASLQLIARFDTLSFYLLPFPSWNFPVSDYKLQALSAMNGVQEKRKTRGEKK